MERVTPFVVRVAALVLLVGVAVTQIHDIRKVGPAPRAEAGASGAAAAATRTRWTVTGPHQPTREAAHQAALTKVAETMTADLGLRIPVGREFVEGRMAIREQRYNEVRLTELGLDPYFAATVTMEMKPSARRELVRQEREGRLAERIGWLVRVTAMTVLALTALALYVRADEWTKGYFTGRLRGAAIAAVVLGAALLWRR